ncbi:hypothetical protein VQ02_05180 [Methylobacterium variabile]|uniref:Uncharacterized protein n=1 Tax=Methylobacterium variabile TaxID=298794 RepID=A0A0J6T6V7_9HYPH|nr:hypothetical protein VQ02_05180 [Methylobacterium variabile]
MDQVVDVPKIDVMYQSLRQRALKGTTEGLGDEKILVFRRTLDIRFERLSQPPGLHFVGPDRKFVGTGFELITQVRQPLVPSNEIM